MAVLHTIKAWLYDNPLTEDPNDLSALATTWQMSRTSTDLPSYFGAGVQVCGLLTANSTLNVKR